jgi:hypothetical protein
MTPCEYCGTPIDEDGNEESDIPAAPGMVSHYAAVCRERVHAALRATQNDLKLKQFEVEGELSVLLEAVQENLQRALKAERALTEARCTRWGLWAMPSEKNSSTSVKADWHKENVVVAYDTPDEAFAAYATFRDNEYWTAEPRPLPTEVRAVPAHLLVGRGR